MLRHLEIRDLWLQKEVAEGKLEISSLRDEDSPADLMTKILKCGDIEERLKGLNLSRKRRDSEVTKEGYKHK